MKTLAVTIAIFLFIQLILANPVDVSLDEVSKSVEAGEPKTEEKTSSDVENDATLDTAVRSGNDTNESYNRNGDNFVDDANSFKNNSEERNTYFPEAPEDFLLIDTSDLLPVDKESSPVLHTSDDNHKDDIEKNAPSEVKLVKDFKPADKLTDKSAKKSETGENQDNHKDFRSDHKVNDNEEHQKEESHHSHELNTRRFYGDFVDTKSRSDVQPKSDNNHRDSGDEERHGVPTSTAALGDSRSREGVDSELSNNREHRNHDFERSHNEERFEEIKKFIPQDRNAYPYEPHAVRHKPSRSHIRHVDLPPKYVENNPVARPLPNYPQVPQVPQLQQFYQNPYYLQSSFNPFGFPRYRRFIRHVIPRAPLISSFTYL